MSLSRFDAGESGAGSALVRVTLQPEALTILPPEISLAGAHFVRSGSDLVVEVADGARVLVEGWFAEVRPSGLADHDGATYEADLIDRLAGPLAPGQFAQLDLGPAQPVGQAVTVEGTVSALRADGTTAVLEAGAPLYPGDVLESGPGAVAGLVLVDGTTLAMGENARLVLDEVIYGGGADDALSLTVLDGVFTLTSGEIAAGDPEAMVISSPSAIAGVRGTRVGIEVEADGDETWILLPDIVGHVGSFQLTQKLTGATLLLTDAFQVATPTGGTVRFLVLTPAGIANILGDVLEAEPENETRADNDEPDEEELARLAEAMAAIAPAAGGDGDAADGTVETALDPSVWSFLVNEQTGLVLAFELNGLLFKGFVVGGGGHLPITPTPPIEEEEDRIVRLGDGGVEFIGTDGPDTVIGGAGGDRIFGAGGDDVLDGGAGGDTLDGGPGDDAVFGGEGNDLIIGGSGEGDDLLGGGPGIDTVKFSSAIQPIIVNLAAGTASGDPAIGDDDLNSVENVIGGQADDEISGNGADNSLSGGEGADSLVGQGGDDVLNGEVGDDVLDGGPGNDAVFGGEGNDLIIGGSGEGDDLLGGGPGIDTVKFSSATQPIVVDLAAGTASGDPAVGHDVLNGIEHVIGGQAGDRILGNGADNSLAGGDGNDVLAGRGGGDALDGEAGNDVLRGGSGDDELVGGAGGGDIALFDGPALRYDVGADGATVGVEDTTGALGADTLSGVEIARFGDRDLLFDGINDRPTVDAAAEQTGTIVHTSFEQDVGDLPPADAIDPDDPNGLPAGALTFAHDHTVTVTFLGASTAYDNTVGIYSIAADGTIGDVRILFPDASEDVLVEGTSSAAFDVAAGERIGLFVVADGADRNNLGGLIDGHFEFRDAAGGIATVDSIAPKLFFVGDDATTPAVEREVAIKFEPGSGVFHSFAAGLNPGGTVNVASGVDEDGGLVVAFDIQPDRIDFDDAVFRVTFDTAVETTFEPVAVAPVIELGDVDSVGLVSAEVSLAGGAGDRLDIDTDLAAALGIQVLATADGFDLTGLGSFDDYEAVLESLVLANDNPAPGARTVTFTVFDTAGASTVSLVTIEVDETFVDGDGFTAFANLENGAPLASAEVG